MAHISRQTSTGSLKTIKNNRSLQERLTIATYRQVRPRRGQTFEWMEDASEAQERTPRSRRGGLGPVTTVTKATRPPKSIVG